ncbi:CPBP family intramembrane glutamic endopeptidase [Nesterenkonia sp. HG001]|uniref:CPBP family intramembrane glutamic endopeptidase n=1 Tax=Nesterenkonia sp. HG001 TaxID=2983207 RepID=UPI002AC5E510|nr:CPBP family intramembrane glutamic endopeptidase [Nesterenkonia sp. HG001]MDZ5078881.1 CPBP family intramembrane metalloprotease [Nesterenkonia sp. HG001]
MSDSAQVSKRESPRLPLAARLALAILGCLVIWVAVTQLTGLWWGQESLGRHVSNAVGVTLLAVPMVLILCRQVDRRPLSSLGLSGGGGALKDMLRGALTWVLPAGVGLAAVVLLGWVEIRVEATPGELVGAVLLLVLLVFVYEALPEELIFRGYIYRNLADAVAPWVAAIGQALLFSFFGTALWVISVGWGVFLERSVLFFSMAVVVGLLRVMSGSVWGPIGFHLAFQVTMQLFLSSRYATVHVDDEAIFTIATAVVAFCAATTVAGFLWRGPVNWREPEAEEPVSPPGESPQGSRASSSPRGS